MDLELSFVTSSRRSSQLRRLIRSMERSLSKPSWTICRRGKSLKLKVLTRTLLTILKSHSNPILKDLTSTRFRKICLDCSTSECMTLLELHLKQQMFTWMERKLKLKIFQAMLISIWILLMSLKKTKLKRSTKSLDQDGRLPFANQMGNFPRSLMWMVSAPWKEDLMWTISPIK